MDTLIIIGVGLASALVGVAIGIQITVDKATQGTTDLLLAAIYLYAEKTYNPTWRQEFIEAVSEYMIENEQMVKALAAVLAKERRINKT